MQSEDGSSAALTNLSTNGTFVNEEKIGKSQTLLLSTGDVISIRYFSNGTLKQYDAYKFHIKSVSKRKANDSSSGNNTSVSDLSLLEKSALAAKTCAKKPPRKAKKFNRSTVWDSDITEENIIKTKRTTRI